MQPVALQSGLRQAGIDTRNTGFPACGNSTRAGFPATTQYRPVRADRLDHPAQGGKLHRSV